MLERLTAVKLWTSILPRGVATSVTVLTVYFYCSIRHVITVIGEKMFEEVRERFARGELEGDQR